MREGAVADGIVLYQVDDKVGIITLNRPKKLNAISRELQLALTEAFARADPATSVVLLRAEGRSFCAGYDIGAQPEGTDDWRSNPTKAHAHLEPQLEFEMARADEEFGPTFELSLGLPGRGQDKALDAAAILVNSLKRVEGGV